MINAHTHISLYGMAETCTRLLTFDPLLCGYGCVCECVVIILLLLMAIWRQSVLQFMIMKAFMGHL